MKKLQCSKCKKWKKPSSFHRRTKGKRGRVSKCKTCKKEYFKQRQLQEGKPARDAVRAKKAREARWEKPWKVLLMNCKRRAKEKGLEFNLKPSDIKIPKNCPVLGIPLYWGRGVGGFKNNSPSIDRIDNTKGYVLGNIIIVSWRANRLKADASLKELKALYVFYKQYEHLLP